MGLDQSAFRTRDGARQDCVARAESGLIEAHLGLCLIKQRVPRPGRGRSGGFRTDLDRVAERVA
jgi:hypothetical protein